MNVELEQLEAMDRIRGMIRRLSVSLGPSVDIIQGIRLLLIEMEQPAAIDDISDALVHLECVREQLNKIVIR